jgi:ligand-binding sensor domain-containing protein
LVNGHVRTYAIQQTEVTGVNVDRRGNVWIRTRGDGVIRAIDGRLDRYSVREGLPTNSPSARFFEGAAGDVWYSETSRRTYRLRDGIRVPVTIPGLPRLTRLSVLFVDNEGSTWLGTVGAGLHRIREPAITMPRPGNAPGPTAVYPILRDRAGVVWIGSGGLTKYAHGRFTTFSEAPKVADVVSSLLEDRNGRLWVGTRSGLRYAEHDRLQRVEDASGLLSSGIFGDPNFFGTADVQRGLPRCTIEYGSRPRWRLTQTIDTGSGIEAQLQMSSSCAFKWRL